MSERSILLILSLLLTGAMAGAAGRHLLARLRRGAVFQPPWCELATAITSAVLGWRVAVGALPIWWLPVPLILCWLGVPLAAVDLAHHRLPDALTLPAYPLLATALTIAALHTPTPPALLLAAALGALLFGGAHLLVHRLTPTNLGAGDVKLSGSLGAVLGPLGWPALLLAPFLSALTTLALALFHRPRPNPHTDADPDPDPHTDTVPGIETDADGPSGASRPPGETGPPRVLRRRVVAHGPGLLVATWLLAAFPGAGLRPG